MFFGRNAVWKTNYDYFSLDINNFVCVLTYSSPLSCTIIVCFQLQRAQQQEQELGQDGGKMLLTEEEQERKITTYEEAFVRIKEATGVSGTQVC